MADCIEMSLKIVSPDNAADSSDEEVIFKIRLNFFMF